MLKKYTYEKYFKKNLQIAQNSKATVKNTDRFELTKRKNSHIITEIMTRRHQWGFLAVSD